MTDPHVASHEQDEPGRPSTGLLSRINAVVARAGMYLSVTGLLVIVTIVVAVTALNRLVWRPLYTAAADRYRLEY